MGTITATPNPTTALDPTSIDVGDIRLEVLRAGDGDRVLYLHAEDGLVLCRPFLDALGEQVSVLAPLHPGWGSPGAPRDMSTVRDLADLYVELVEQLAATDGRPTPVIGSSVGAWMAAEMAATRHPAVGPVVLIAPVGVKLGSRTERDFVDLYATHPADQQAVLSSKGMERLASLDDEALLRVTRAQEATARLCWQPYFHDPGLPRRLGRVRSEVTIVVPGEDAFVLAERYCERYASLFGGPVELMDIAGAGHRIEEDAPVEAAAAVLAALERYASHSDGPAQMAKGA